MRSIEIRKKSLVYISEGATMSVLKDYGSRCRQYTANMLFVIQISGLHTMKFCQQKDTVQWEKKVEKQAILNASISQCGKEFQDCQRSLQIKYYQI